MDDFTTIERDKYESMLDACIKGLMKGDESNLFKMVEALQWFKGDERLLRPLRFLLKDSNTRIHGLRGIGLLGVLDGLDDLLEFLANADDYRHDEVEEAIRMLGDLGSDKASPTLYDIMSGAEYLDVPEAKLIAVESLLKVSERDGELALKALERGCDSPDSGTSEACRMALRVLNEKEWSRKGFVTLEAALSDETEEDI